MSMIMALKWPYRCKIVVRRIQVSFKSVYAVFMCNIGVKYQYGSRAVCAHFVILPKRTGCALIGACALIRTNTAYLYLYCKTLRRDFEQVRVYK